MFCANDAPKCLAYFLFKKWHKFLSSWRRYSKIFHNSRAKLIILTNFMTSKLLRHIDLVDFWNHQQTGHSRNKLTNESEFLNKINISTQWRSQKVSIEGLKFRRTVTPQINNMESTEGKTIVGWSVEHATEKICKITLKLRVFVHSGSKFWYNAFTRLTRRMKS